MVVVAWTSAASAGDGDALATRVQVDAPEGCASAASFWRATSRRTDRLRAAGDRRAEASLEVVIRPAERGARGELRIVRGGLRSAHRKVHAASCEEVTQALSLIAALAFDPAARTETDDVAGPSSGAEAPVSWDDASAAARPVTPDPLPVATPASAAPASAHPKDRPTTRRSTERIARWHLGGGAHVGALGLASPGAVVAYGAFLDLERDAPGLSPSFRAGAMRADGQASSAGVDAALAWTVARVSACPVRLDLAPRIAVRPCAGADLGSLAASASGVPRAQDRARPWAAPAVSARLAWSPMRVVFVELEGGAALPLVRDELAVDPSVSLYRAPAVMPFVQASGGVRFW